MNNSLKMAAFDALIDRGIAPEHIDADTLQEEMDSLGLSTALAGDDTSPCRADVDRWRISKARELFYHVEFMVDRLRELVDADAFEDENPETRETIRRLNLSARSIFHMSNPDDAATLMQVYHGDRDGAR